MRADVNWFGVLAHHAARSPGKRHDGVRGRGDSRTRQMAARARALAGGLHARGSRPGDVVGLLSYNCPEFLQTMFAANCLGAIAMPINWRLAAPEVRFILEHSERPGAGLRRGAARSGQRGDRRHGGRPRPVVHRGAEPHRGWTTLAELERGRAPPPQPVATEPDDVHRLMYTSGTTGRPKGVMLTHANLAWKNLAHIVEFGFTDADLGLACGPLYHVGALDLTTTSLIAAGATTIIHRTFDAAAVVDELERSRVTTVWLAPAMVNAIMALPDVEQRDLSSVRVIINGGEKMPIPLIERIQRTFPSAWFADAYGLTETVSGDTFLDRDSIVTQAGERRPARACISSSRCGTTRAGRCRPASAARSCCAGPRCSRATGATPRPRPGRSPAAGSTPATSGSATRTATCSSSTG